MVFQLVFAAMPPALINRIEPCVKNRVLCNSQMAKRAHLAKPRQRSRLFFTQDSGS
jgi:hypothetical protein